MRARTAVALGALTLAACAAPTDRAGVDPTTVVAPSSPNWALAAPAGLTTATTPTRPSPVFAADAAAVAAALAAVAAAEPRTRALPAPAGVLTFEQRSAVLGFPDVVSAKAVALGPDRASVVVYSASVYGYSDLGVNAARLDRWLGALEARLPAAP